MRVNSRTILYIAICLLVLLGAFLRPAPSRAMPPGTLLYRTGGDAKMFGYKGPLIEVEKGIVRSVNAGHVAIYIGQEDGVDYVVEAAAGGIVKTPAKYFVNRADGETFLGARIPSGLTPLQQAKAVAIAKSLADSDLAYDFDFHRQKGARSGQWTCVGLTEKIYESADISNPHNLGALEYDRDFYAVDITPDGFDDTSPADPDGDRFSKTKEFSEVARRRNFLFPAPELIGFDAGLEHEGKRYIFMPYTQFLQPTLKTVMTDIPIASSFSAPEIRGETDWLSIGLRWTLINNPVSSLKKIAAKTGELASLVGDKLFGPDPEPSAVVLNEERDEEKPETAKTLAVVSKRTGEPEVVTGLLPADNPKMKEPEEAEKKAETVSSPRVAVNTKTPTSGPSETKATTPKVSVLYDPTITAENEDEDEDEEDPVPVEVNHDPEAQEEDDAPQLARISRIYATGNNDWIELYNPTDHDFDLAAAGYRLEKTKSAEDPSLIMRLGNPADGLYPGGTIIPAKGRYLIVRAGASAHFKNRAQAIATRTDFSWTGSGYTIYLGTAALSSSADEDIVEAVGFGPTAAYFQGSGPAPEINDNYFLDRMSYNQNNATDFTFRKSDDPSIDWNLQIEEDEEEDEEDEEEDEEEDPIAATTPLALIGGIYATGSNDWIELHNPGPEDFDLATAGYRLEKTVTADDPSLVMRIGNQEDGSYPGGTMIGAGQNYLIVRDDASSFHKDRADAIATREEFVWTGKDYTIYLASGAVASSTDPDIMDAVGFGAGASYFAGSGPAPEIVDGYILKRSGDSGDNADDFELIPTDDPDYLPEPEEEIDDFYEGPTPIDSPELVNLWHFDDCYGPGQWAVGKWGCARDISLAGEAIAAPLVPAPDLDSLSVSFYYKKNHPTPTLTFRLLSSGTVSASLKLDPNLITIEGLPGSAWRYYQEVRFDENWHQVTLVINQAEDYWAVYLDGEEAVRQGFMANLPVVDMIEFQGTSGSTLLDEVALWHRPLSSVEILSHYQQSAPFSPLPPRAAQKDAQLKHFWEFEEDSGTTALDSTSGVLMPLDAGQWTARAHNNYAVSSAYNKPINVPLDLSLSAHDFSLAFWWNNSSHPGDGKAVFSLTGAAPESKKLLSFEASNYRLNYSFNGLSSILAEGHEVGIPADDEWHHIALVYDSYRYRLSLYVDAIESVWIPHIWMKDTEVIKNLEISTPGDSSSFDDLRIYEGALRAAEIEDIFANTK